ncbi:hypothetical protein ACIGO8_33270 [Streptomyces sp. NPDC053493]|uniref:hypothetical protein n=1 Tax=Streptomyces sp. NPDC053493 TaxID=3365705 RepID=UPI0037CF43F7
MAQWEIVAVLSGDGSSNRATIRSIESFEGDAAFAEGQLLKVVNNYSDDTWKVTGRKVFKHSDRSYFVRIDGLTSTYRYLIQLFELITDGESPGFPDKSA